MRRQIAYNRIVASDRRTAAIHEAGHVVILRWAGTRFIEAAIFPTDGEPDLRTYSWSGQTFFPRRRLSHIRKIMIAVAGAVAEQVWLQRFQAEPELDDADIEAIIETLSPTDWRLCGSKPDEWTRKHDQACFRVYDLLRGALWPDLVRTSRILITTGGCYAKHSMR